MKNNKIVYLDNAATTWPKPPEVITAMSDYILNYGGIPGRSGHSFSIKSAREVFDTRELLAQLFNAPNSERIVFTLNATHAINYALKGIVKEGTHVITSCMEHNAVYRPLKHLESKGIIELTLWQRNEDGIFDLNSLKEIIKENTQIIILTHASNVTGQVLPIEEVGKICDSKGITFIVDAAQTAGFLPVDMQTCNIDILIFSGHKKLYGPSGVGGLCIKNDIPIDALFQGGSGSKSEMAAHPSFYPDRLEAGTLNTTGIIGLKAGLKHILKKGINNIRNEQSELKNYLKFKMSECEEIIIYSPKAILEEMPVISFNINNITSSNTAMFLDKDYGIMTRSGLHCSPLAHKSIGTFPNGTVRFGLGIFTTKEEIDYTINSLKKLIIDKG